ncbi:tRNA (uridine(54)-C5)-methyltransferase TrmA [Umboniibacter marinipuniceus]|uniref:tRNA/tmRNA (uracil-C(5))-methyltransferase n=1 Tax=Umboniibacter marinipuniceus TaxID=569599 RepID=A0A3M0A7E7_9GAMM|nr:tRNA (uridine(54)-C5)-methyltransferase TrmA [Umboniibacter marinipuniceus]RMA81071.1 tRNA (uracil-5-)-methyltransferase [Umboniibacter marinipuniceus]
MKFTQPENYQALFAEKTQRIKAMLSPFYQGELDTYESAPEFYRMRAEFRVWHTDDGAHYAMFQPGDNKTPIFIDQFPVASKEINALMPKLLAEVNNSELLAKRLFHIEFLATLSGDMLVTFIYHRPLSDEWIALAKLLEQRYDIAIIGRSRKQKVAISRDWVDEVLTVNGNTLHYRQNEGGFSQPNAAVCEKMLEWAIAQSAQQNPKDLLELYCGNGNFSVALAPHYRKVLATEMAKTSIRAAQLNAASNEVENLSVARLSAEEFTQAWNREREFNRLKGIDLDDYDVSTIFVDPPRAGMDPDTTTLCQRFERIIYISCNPATLVENLQQLTETHEVKRAALFDQFPYTDHMEAGVILERR